MSDIVTLNGYKIKDEKAVRSYETVAEMKADTKLKEGYHIKTKGYYQANDGGHGEYVIVDDDTLVEDGGSIHVLTNGLRSKLIIENDTINVKQFGAKGDGITDNATNFTNALEFIKNNNIGNLYINEGTFVMNDTQFIIPNGLHLYGCGEKSVIKVDSLSNQIFMTNEHYLNYDYKDTFIIENFKILKNVIGTSGAGKRCMRFACTDNVIIRNIVMYSDVDSQFGAIDMYSYNSNVLIENCKAYKSNSTSGLQNGGFAIREYSTSHVSENITVRDCLIEKDGKDESLWLDGWRGTIRNILVDNFTMIDNSGSDGISCAWIGGNASGSNCENVIVSNSYFYKKELGYRILAVGDSEEANSTCTASNIKIVNCTFETDEYLGSSNYAGLVQLAKYLVKEGCTIENCTFKNNDSTNNLPCFIYGTQKPSFSINNKFYGKSSRGIFGLYSSKGDLFELAPSVTLLQNVSNIDNIKCLESIPYLLIVNASADITNVNITNCKSVVCARFLQNNGNTNGIKYLIKDCQIENTNNLTANYNQDTNHMSLTLLNTDIKNTQITNASNINLSVSGLSIEGNVAKGIPSAQNDRANYPIGTIFFSNTATKSIVRKISDGDSTSNWEEV